MKESDRKKYAKPARRMARRTAMTLALLLTAATASAQSLSLTCDGCGQTYPYEYAESLSQGHYTISKAPTCTQAGDIRIKCHNCGNVSTIFKYLPALGHDWSATTHQAVTCTEAEHDERTCNRCGEREVTNIIGDALGHNFENGICTRCGNILPLDFSDDAANDLTPFNEKKTDVTLSGRKIYGDNNWNTLCLPFALTAEQIAASPLAGATIMALDGTTSNLTGGTLTLNFTPVTSIEAGKPYIVRMVKGKDGATAPTYTVGDGNEYHYLYPHGNLMDGNNNRGWSAYLSAGPFCEFQADQPVYVTGYTLTTLDISNEIPTVWTLKAKLKTTDEWTTIDSRNTNDNPGDALSKKASKSYTISTPSLYQYFRIDGTQVNSGYLFTLAELTMHSFYPKDCGGTIDDPKFNEVTITATEPVAVTFDNNGTTIEAKKCRFVGNYSPFAITDGNINEIVYLGSDNTIGYATAARMLRNFRAHFEIPTLTAGTRAVTRTVLDFSGHSDGTTGIKEVKSEGVKSEKSGVEGWFSLDGRRLNGRPSAKGLYIHNGRKEVVR